MIDKCSCWQDSSRIEKTRPFARRFQQSGELKEWNVKEIDLWCRGGGGEAALSGTIPTGGWKDKSVTRQWWSCPCCSPFCMVLSLPPLDFSSVEQVLIWYHTSSYTTVCPAALATRCIVNLSLKSLLGSDFSVRLTALSLLMAAATAAVIFRKRGKYFKLLLNLMNQCQIHQ